MKSPTFFFNSGRWGLELGGLSLFCDLKLLLVHIGINMLPSLGRIRLIWYLISMFIQVLISVSNQAIYETSTGLHIF